MSNSTELCYNGKNLKKQLITNDTGKDNSLTSLALAFSASADQVMMTKDGFTLGTKLQGSVMLSPLAYS